MTFIHLIKKQLFNKDYIYYKVEMNPLTDLKIEKIQFVSDSTAKYFSSKFYPSDYFYNMFSTILHEIFENCHKYSANPRAPITIRIYLSKNYFLIRSSNVILNHQKSNYEEFYKNIILNKNSKFNLFQHLNNLEYAKSQFGLIMLRDDYTITYKLKFKELKDQKYLAETTYFRELDEEWNLEI
jgi:hypothetical protein